MLGNEKICSLNWMIVHTTTMENDRDFYGHVHSFLSFVAVSVVQLYRKYARTSSILVHASSFHIWRTHPSPKIESHLHQVFIERLYALPFFENLSSIFLLSHRSSSHVYSYIYVYVVLDYPVYRVIEPHQSTDRQNCRLM